MSEVKKTTKWDVKLKDIRFDEDGILVDDLENEIDLGATLKAAFGANLFTLSASAKEEEVQDLDELIAEQED